MPGLNRAVTLSETNAVNTCHFCSVTYSIEDYLYSVFVPFSRLFLLPLFLFLILFVSVSETPRNLLESIYLYLLVSSHLSSVDFLPSHSVAVLVASFVVALVYSLCLSIRSFQNTVSLSTWRCYSST